MKFLFTAGTARGGTNFRTLMLNNHSSVQMSIDPFIPLFRFYRNSILKHHNKLHLLNLIPNKNILDDYYFDSTKLEIMETIQNSDANIKFDLSQWIELKKDIANRMSLASMNLIKHLDKLPAPTFKEVFYNTMNLVTCESVGDVAWAGFNDNWTCEFFPLIAKLIPDAKFILHLRDPRAVIHSSEFAESDPKKHPPIITFARHLRKHYTYATQFSLIPELKDKLLITKYEDFLDNTNKALIKVSNFLNIDFNTQMGDISNFKKADGSQWSSSKNDYKNSKDVWRENEYKNLVELTEFICAPEMSLHGYIPEIYNNNIGVSNATLNFCIQNINSSLGWHTNYQETERTIGCELYRERVLRSKISLSNLEIRRMFLFPEVYQQIQSENI